MKEIDKIEEMLIDAKVQLGVDENDKPVYLCEREVKQLAKAIFKHTENRVTFVMEPLKMYEIGNKQNQCNKKDANWAIKESLKRYKGEINVSKICTKCKVEKPVNEFSKALQHNDNLASSCKRCEKKYKREWYLKNQKTCVMRSKIWYETNKVEALKKQTIYTKKYRKELKPWFVSFDKARQRCNNPKQHGYKNYGGRGIKCLITLAECGVLWNRDKAYGMDRPSIDRKNSNKNYTFDNCQFIELRDNSAKTSRAKPVTQYTPYNIIIQTFKSMAEASRVTNINAQAISYALNSKSNTSHGFIWRHAS